MNQTRSHNPVSFWTLLALMIALISLAMVAYLLVELQQYRAGTAALLKSLSGQLNTLTQKDVEYTVKIDRTIPFSANVPINQDLSVPVKFELNDTFPIEAVIPTDTKINLPISTTIPVNQKFNVAINVLGQDIALPVAIQGTLPVDVNLDVPFKQDIKINTKVPLKLPVDTVIKVNLSQNIPIQAQVPIKMEVPVTISLKDLTGGTNLTEGLDTMIAQLNAGPDPLVVAALIGLFVLIWIILMVIYFSSRRQAAAVPTYTATNLENPVMPEHTWKNKP